MYKPEPISFFGFSSKSSKWNALWKEEINKIITSGSFISGENVKKLEQEFSGYCKTPFAVSTASGTDSLVLALRACGVKAGDEVITTPFSFISSSSSIALVGARPVFIDIETDSFNIDAEKIDEAITENTKAILPVHLFGYPANMVAIAEQAQKYHLAIIEDCAQSLGAQFNDQFVGSWKNSLGCFSFYPSKILGCYGDGGIITTDNEKMYHELKVLKDHGITDPYTYSSIGYNSRLDEIQAALLRIKLKDIEESIEKRREAAHFYNKSLKDLPVTLPQLSQEKRHVYNVYTIRTPKQSVLQQALKKANIAFRTYYPLPLHLQQAFAYLGYQPGSMPNAEQASAQAISLPLHPGMTEEQLTRVCDVVRQVLT